MSLPIIFLCCFLYSSLRLQGQPKTKKRKGNDYVKDEKGLNNEVEGDRHKMNKNNTHEADLQIIMRQEDDNDNDSFVTLIVFLTNYTKGLFVVIFK